MARPGENLPLFPGGLDDAAASPAIRRTDGRRDGGRAGSRIGRGPSGQLRRLPRSGDHAGPRDAPRLRPGHRRLGRKRRPRSAPAEHRTLAAREIAQEAYDPNADASRQEMRTFVCAQCHVEYYCASKETLFFPWDNGLEGRADRADLRRARSSRTARRSSITSTARPAHRSTRPSIPSSSCGARASTPAAASAAPIATCPTSGGGR